MDGDEAEALQADVGTLVSVQSMIERAVDRWKKLTLVVNNAYSGGLRGDATSLSEETQRTLPPAERY
jgi:NAD(P)-dependent dehydrogenase (short-subunit alcohol dehydrogenase family)